MTAQNTQKTRLFYSIDDGVTFIMIPQLTNAAIPNQANPELDASDFESDAMEYIGGLRDSGTIGFQVNFDGGNTDHQALITHQASGAVIDWKVSVVEGDGLTRTEGTFKGFLQEFASDMAVNNVQNWTGSVRVSGAVTFAHGAIL